MNDHKKEQAQKRSVPLPKEKPVRKPKKKKLTEGAESAIITEQICDVCNTVFSSAKSLKYVNDRAQNASLRTSK